MLGAKAATTPLPQRLALKQKLLLNAPNLVSQEVMRAVLAVTKATFDDA